MLPVSRTSGSALIALVGLMLSIIASQPNRASAAGGGTARWTDYGKASRTTTYSYIITGAPPNMCGTLELYRNDVYQRNDGWICTDVRGNATKGPWGPPTSDETARDIRITWADGSSTTGGETHINDVTAPYIRSDLTGGYGVPIPTRYGGRASDGKWGTGFDFGPAAWSSLTITYRNLTTGNYYAGSGYTSSTPVYAFAAPSPYIGHVITWTASPPPLSAHNTTDTYQWCVSTSDYFYASNTDCVTFYGPR